ncbi:MAG TPA: hypothetical protein VG537_02430 [Candidatus Kapabacteria bacterium]|jgi:hypothetical protein|nr:hypothetical protein [Candidatus Kapabacteria bacterium]
MSSSDAEKKPKAGGPRITNDAKGITNDPRGITNDARDRSENRKHSSLRSSGQFVRSLSTPPGEPYNDPGLRKK